MRINRIISLLIIIVMCVSVCAFPVMADSYNVSGEEKLYALGVLDKPSDDLARPVSRIEMVKYAVRLYGKDMALSMGATPFADVPAENEASGAVNFALSKNIISPSAMFYPDRTVRYEEALKMIVTALDYGNYASMAGGYPNGYMTAAAEIGLLKNVSANGGDGLTLKTVVQLLDNALLSVVYTPTLVVNNKLNTEFIISDASSKSTVLSKRFNLSCYGAYISEFNASTGILKAEIRSANKSNDVSGYKAGDTPTFTLAKNAVVGDIKYTIAKIYVNDADELIYAEVDKSIEVVTGHIYEINESHNKADQYVSYINNLAFEDTEDYIDVSDECKMYFNGETAESNQAYPFIGAFARAVIYKDEIISLEAWSLSEGGIITNVGDDEIEYRRGETPVVFLSGVSGYEDVSIYINGWKSELWALTSDVIFDWYASSDNETLIIVGSSRAITDKLETMTKDKLTIGGVEYPLSESFDVYTSSEGENYRNKQNYSLLLSRTVTAYIDFAGYVRYIRPVLEDELSKEYYGVVTGYKENGLEPPSLQVHMIIDGEVLEKEYLLTEKTASQQSAKLDEIKDKLTKIKNADAAQRNEKLKKVILVYKIRVNDREEITSISDAEWFFEPALKKTYENSIAAAEASELKDEVEIGYKVSDFTSDAKAYTSNPRVYFNDSIICALYCDDNGSIKVKTVPWSMLKGRSGSNLLLTPFAEPGSSDVELMLIRGDVEAIGYTRVEFVKRGMATDITTGYDKERDKEVINVKVDGKLYSISRYQEAFKDVTDAAYIVYATDNPFLSKDEIKLNYVFNLSGAPDSWETVGATETGLHKDEAQKVDAKRVYFESGDAWYMADDVPVYEVVETGERTKFIPSHRGNVEKGTDVWYVYYNYEIRALFHR